MRPLHEQIQFGIGEQLERFVRQRDRPVIAELRADIEVDEAVRNAAECRRMKALVVGVPRTDTDVEDGVASQLAVLIPIKSRPRWPNTWRQSGV